MYLKMSNFFLSLKKEKKKLEKGYYITFYSHYVSKMALYEVKISNYYAMQKDHYEMQERYYVIKKISIIICLYLNKRSLCKVKVSYLY